jgi:hypothetical protein
VHERLGALARKERRFTRGAFHDKI